MGLLDCLRALATVGPIGVEPLDARSVATGLCHNICGAVAVLHADSRDRDSHKQTKRVPDDVALSAFDFLARVVAALATLR